MNRRAYILNITIITCAITFGANSQAHSTGSYFLEFKRSISIENMAVETDFAIRQGMLAMTSNTSLLILSPDNIRLYPQNKLSGLAAITIDYQGNIWAIDTYGHEVLHFATDTGNSRRIPFNIMTMRYPTSINSYSNGVFIYEKDSGHYAHIDIRNQKITTDSLIKAHRCIAQNQNTIICISQNQKSIFLYEFGRLVVTHNADDNHIRYSDISFDDSGHIWVTSDLTGRITGYSSRLIPQIHSELVDEDIEKPQKITTDGKSIWILDSNRKALTELTLRSATTDYEYILLAEEYYSVHNSTAALEQVNKIDPEYPDSDELLTLKANIYYRLRHYHQAITTINMIKVLTPELQLLQANIHFYLNNMHESEKLFKALQSKSAKFNLGVVYLRQNKYGSAATIFEKLLATNSHDHVARLALIEAYAAQENYRSLLKHCRLLLNNKELRRQAQFYYGLGLRKTGKIKQAIYYLQRSGKEGPYYSQALKLLHELYIEQGDMVMAEKMKTALTNLKMQKQKLNSIKIREQL